MLLFARDYIGVLFKKWFGVEVKNGNGNGKEHRIQDLEKHAEIANSEMHEVKDRLTNIEKEQSAQGAKLDIIIGHLKI